ncbi:c-di-GMP phosphodiesterase [Leptospira sp. GIMC2001]|uniref:c-di-GMP phosphodiesterase n=1 Tax=Leptospira sp. GIMC2001 TaxID=1513297 RepID=UPI00234B5046|nr:c-di-GMP phosphodiesterase [Leptospira sp. GIMC2001]WCL48407.1 c-di-GMP phosphodiesterase [Leptospira sp. GIMC2001]
MSSNDKLNKNALQKFDFTQEIIDSFHQTQSIPVDFYNKDGQILIHKKPNAAPEDFSKLLKFEFQGIYFRTSDLDKLFTKESQPTSVNGKAVSFVNLLDEEKAKEQAKLANDLLIDLKKSAFNSGHVRSVQKSMDTMLSDFTSVPEYENGLINIMEVLSGAGVSRQSELMTKRTVVAMGLKIRSKKSISKGDEKKDKKEHMNLMTASYLADLGYTKIETSSSADLKPAEYEVIKTHPIISYLMVANSGDLDPMVKKLILHHHRPHKGGGVNNNFPNDSFLIQKLLTFKEKYLKETGKDVAIADIDLQIQEIQNQNFGTQVEEDIAYLSLASEFASLTTEQSWRGAKDSRTALKMILNNSFFSYSDKNIRDLFDYVGLSLNNNQSIINRGDLVITASWDSKKKIHFEICKVQDIDRFQTRPLLERVGSITPIFHKENKFLLKNFDMKTFVLDRRRAVYNLMNAVDPRRVIYLIDPELNPKLYEDINQKLV